MSTTKNFSTKRVLLTIALATSYLVALAISPVDAFCTNRNGACTQPNALSSQKRVLNKRIISGFVLRLSAENNGDSDSEDESDEPGLMTNLMKDTKDLTVGDWVVAKRDLPSLGIRSGVVYKIRSIFLKGTATQESTGLGVEVIPLETYGEETPSAGYTKYLKVYNPRDHDKLEGEEKGVLVTPEEIGLVSVKADWTEALFLAVPGFFWVFAAMAFSNYYTDRYGGSFLDAFFRT